MFIPFVYGNTFLCTQLGSQLVHGFPEVIDSCFPSWRPGPGCGQQHEWL